jgi:hypothetical protein
MSVPKRKLIIDDSPELFDEFNERPQISSSSKRLKPPPEIWELVHPVPTIQFNPVRVLAARLASKSVLLILTGLVILISVTIACWKLPIAQSVIAVLPKDDVPSKTRTKPTPNRVGQPDNRSRVPATSNVENLSTSIPDALPTPDVIETFIANRRPLKSSKRKLNRPNVEKESVAVVAEPAHISAEPPSARSSRLVGKAKDESSLNLQRKSNSAEAEVNSPSNSKQNEKPKVIPWP